MALEIVALLDLPVERLRQPDHLAHFSTLDGARGRVADFSRFGADLPLARCTLADLTQSRAL